MKRRLLIAGLAAPLLALLAVAWIGSNGVLRPPWYVNRSPEQGLPPLDGDAFRMSLWAGSVHDPRRDFGLDFSDVAFPTADGATLRGWLVPAPGAGVGVVLVHGAAADRREFLRTLPAFHEAGYAALLFDCREHGTSDGSGRGFSLGGREAADVSAAAAFLGAQPGIARIAAVGTSQGAASSILAAASDPAIDLVVAENPFTRARDFLPDAVARIAGVPVPLNSLVATVALWRMGPRMEPIDVVARIAPRPILFLHGTKDAFIPSEESRELFARAGEPKELWIAANGEHAQLWNLDPAEWNRRVVGFVARYLPAR